jgi:CheY-like chemotaxis protein
MSKQTITRTAPALLPRLFRKPSQVSEAAAAILAACDRDRPRRSERRSVLLVEDDRHTAQVSSAVVEELGYAVTWVPNGREALDAISASDFDAILLDLVMPDVDGFVVLERLQSTNAELLRRVIVTTGIPARYVDHLDQSKIGGVIHKPMDIARLEHLLSRCAGGKDFEPGGEFSSLN